MATSKRTAKAADTVSVDPESASKPRTSKAPAAPTVATTESRDKTADAAPVSATGTNPQLDAAPVSAGRDKLGDASPAFTSAISDKPAD